MKTEIIDKILIDNSGTLCIKPHKLVFDMIYRSAMGVHWNDNEFFLYHHSKGSWSVIQWYQQIIKAVNIEYGINLVINQKTKWENINDIIKNEIMHI